MLSICPYFHVHQPFRIKNYRVFDIGNDHSYFNDSSDTDLNNRRILEKVACKSYIPTNKILRELLDKHIEFKFSLSFSGVVLDQMEEYMPEVLESFQDLISTGRVEVLADTYYHSLAFFYSRREFERQVDKHRKKIQKLFNYTPRVFRHTELAYRNDLAKWAEKAGYIGIMAEGWEGILGLRSPNFLYNPPGCKKIKLLLKNYRLSDDIAFRFSEKSWAGWPLDARKFSKWVENAHGNGNTVNLFMDYETFGEHQWEDTGIFDFLRALPGEILKNKENIFKTPTETALSYDTIGELDVPNILTWADTERDLTAWTGNEMQYSAIKIIYEMEDEILATGNEELIEDWRRLQISDHFYYMCTKWFSDGDVHTYFSPYNSPYDAYITFMNAINDLQLRVGIEKKSLSNRLSFIFRKALHLGIGA